LLPSPNIYSLYINDSPAASGVQIALFAYDTHTNTHTHTHTHTYIYIYIYIHTQQRSMNIVFLSNDSAASLLWSRGMSAET
jgi:hypothetical protein